MYACMWARGDNHRQNGETKKEARLSRRGLPKRLTRAGLLEEKPNTAGNSYESLARGIYMYIFLYMYIYIYI